MTGLADGLGDALLGAGVALAGFADLRQVPADVRHGLARAVPVAVTRDAAILAGLKHGPTAAAVKEFHRHNELLRRLGSGAARVLRGYGLSACLEEQVAVDGATLTTALPHKAAATRAGLGWIGRCAVLVTEVHGPAVRLTGVLTDAHCRSGQRSMSPGVARVGSVSMPARHAP